ncbi:MAG: MOSC domain-containing protein [Gammaproteobacteria bacterium]|nr:MOSC domain-containing protein [Gammaproteobacteria bacterium]
MQYLTRDQLDAGLAHIQASPSDGGRLEMLVRRPRTDEREVLEVGTLDLEAGLVGDKWRNGARGKDSAEHLDMQLTLMNARVAALVAGIRDRWPLAGDQLYVDLDLSDANLPPGTHLSIGETVIEVTAVPHTGCRKFSARFGPDAIRFVNSKQGRRLNLRGVNAKVVEPGTIRVGDIAGKVSPKSLAIGSR